jgi:hypothetical protein
MPKAPKVFTTTKSGVMKIVCDATYNANFSININNVDVTVVVPSGTTFEKGETILLNPVKRKTGDGFYLVRKMTKSNIKIEIVEEDATDTIVNQIDLSIFGI